MKIPVGRSPLALVSCGDDRMSRALESAFRQQGFVVSLSRSGAQTIQLATLAEHDVVVIDESLEDIEAVRVCGALRDAALFDHSVPVLITSPGPVNQRARREAYAAGAWEYYGHPIETDLLFLRLSTFVRAREEILFANSEGFVNASTGLYTSFGMLQLAGKFGARALRKHEAFACVAFAPELVDREVESSNTLRPMPAGLADVAHIFREQSRQSDVVGHMGDSRFAILAPETDAEGARLLVSRLQRELDRAAKSKTIDKEIRLRAGFSAVSDLAASHLNVPDLVHRAEQALDRTPMRASASPVVNFDELKSL
jgi:PleD family two-component response regulator